MKSKFYHHMKTPFKDLLSVVFILSVINLSSKEQFSQPSQFIEF